MTRFGYSSPAPRNPCPKPDQGRLGAADPRLSDPAWLARTYVAHGDMWIALETGADRKTVRRRREQFGIAAAPRGPRRGATTLPVMYSPVDGLAANERALIDRYRADRRAAATEDLLVSRLRAAHDAKTAGDDLAYESAMFGIATVAVRIAEHRQKLRRAA